MFVVVDNVKWRGQRRPDPRTQEGEMKIARVKQSETERLGDVSG